MSVEHSITVNTSPERIFAIYADVASWCTWDPDTQSSSLSGPFQTGATGRLTPTKGNTVAMVLSSVVPNKHFTVESKIPLLFRMVFEHELIPANGATRVTHRVTFHGPLAFILRRVIGSQLNKGLPATLANLKAMAENAA
jgi:hypothetical protein